MSEINWYFPRTIEEVKDLLKKERVIPHGGGTHILRSNMKRIKGLIDLHYLPLKFHHTKKGMVEIGSNRSFSEVSEHLDSQDILARALSRSASTPLRNRITVGGSIAAFPVWSDLMGPLIALEAEVSLIGEREGSFSISDYIKNSELRKGTLITGVSFKKDGWISYYYRETRTHFDYPAFTISILLKKSAKVIEDIRIVIVGCIGKWKRLYLVEESLRGKREDEVEIDGIGENLLVKFTMKKFLSPEYLEHLARVYTERGLKDVMRR